MVTSTAEYDPQDDGKCIILAEANNVRGRQTWRCYVCGQRGDGPIPPGHGSKHGLIDGAGI